MHGLALRVELSDGGIADLLLASTGCGPTGRFLLHAGRRPERLFYGSLLPYRTRSGPLVLGAHTGEDGSWELLWAHGRGPWTPFARVVPGPQLPEATISFDPVLHQFPGLEQYDALARLRLPAYRTARAARDERVDS